MKSKTIPTLFFTMLKIGLFTFGGGYAMIALLENEFVTKRRWLEQEEFLDVAAIAESTPGPIAINSATYIGFKQAGILGSVVATLGMTLPSFCIIYAISLFFDAFLSLTAVACAFRGIQIAVLYLILSAGLRMLKKMEKTPFSWAVLLLTLIGMVTLTLLSVKLSTIVYILAGGVAGVALWLIRRLRHGKKGGEA
ncbi:MAG: chromate transporter [Clostridia bacterium]|nr:chromate transporter [Clostridia bacterium]